MMHINADVILWTFVFGVLVILWMGLWAAVFR